MKIACDELLCAKFLGKKCFNECCEPGDLVQLFREPVQGGLYLALGDKIFLSLRDGLRCLHVFGWDIADRVIQPLRDTMNDGC